MVDEIGFMGWASSVEAEEEEGADNPMMMAADDVADNAPLPDLERVIRQTMGERWGTEEGWDFTIAEELLYGSVLWTQQPNGNCVGSSGSIAISSRLAHDVYCVGDAEETFGDAVWGKTSGVVFIPYSYGAGRHEGGFRGNGDGSSCQGQLKGFHNWGFMPCYLDQLQEYGDGSDFPQSTSSVNKRFGRDAEEIKKHATTARQWSLDNSGVVGDLDDLWLWMCTKYCPVMQASNWGFRYSHEWNGFKIYEGSGRWSHQMSLRRLIKVQGEILGWVGNQWGKENHSGDCGFWVMGSELNAYIKDCYAVALGQISGTPLGPPEFG